MNVIRLATGLLEVFDYVLAVEERMEIHAQILKAYVKIKSEKASLSYITLLNRRFGQTNSHKTINLKVAPHPPISHTRRTRFILLRFTLSQPGCGSKPNASSVSTHEPIFILPQKSTHL